MDDKSAENRCNWHGRHWSTLLFRGSLGEKSTETAPKAEISATAQHEKQLQIAANAIQRRNALAWELASQIISTEMNNSGGEDTLPGLGVLQRSSQTYTTILQDPFSFVANLASRPMLVSATRSQQDKLAALVSELLAEVNRAARP